jgi:hypothetical protein
VTGDVVAAFGPVEARADERLASDRVMSAMVNPARSVTRPMSRSRCVGGSPGSPGDGTNRGTGASLVLRGTSAHHGTVGCKRHRGGDIGLIAAGLAVAAAACSSGPAPPSLPRPTAARTSAAVAPRTPAAPSACTQTRVNAAIAGFFTAWNREDATGLRRMFESSGDLDMTGKTQGGPNVWTPHPGPAAIAAYVASQWQLGERFSYGSISSSVGSIANGSQGFAPGGVGTATGVVATFADGTAQPIAFSKFVYDCASQGFFHVVIVATKPAA